MKKFCKKSQKYFEVVMNFTVAEDFVVSLQRIWSVINIGILGRTSAVVNGYSNDSRSERAGAKIVSV